jgi:hypothetical protein
MSEKFQLIRFFFFKVRLEGSLPNSLTSEEVRQPWTTQKEWLLQELNINVNPPILTTFTGFYHQNIHSKSCFMTAYQMVTLGSL